MSGTSRFPTTRWTLVLSAGENRRPDAAPAFSSLCEIYWQPVYAYLRRSGHAVEEAQDLTQGFFTALLEKGHLSRAEREKGRFRSFLLGSLKHFVSDEHDRRFAQKRGGREAPLSFDFALGEEVYQREPADRDTPERIFEKQWASTLVRRVMEKLEAETAATGRRDQLRQLKPYLLGGSDEPYVRLAAQLGTSEGAVKVAVHRFRKRYRELFRAEIAETVASPDEVDDEIRRLLHVLEG